MAFAVAGADPILHLVSWLSNLATASVLVLRIATSCAVPVYFRRQAHGVGFTPVRGAADVRRRWAGGRTRSGRYQLPRAHRSQPGRLDWSAVARASGGRGGLVLSSQIASARPCALRAHRAEQRSMASTPGGRQRRPPVGSASRCDQDRDDLLFVNHRVDDFLVRDCHLGTFVCPDAALPESGRF
jgi:hypothetical protein